VPAWHTLLSVDIPAGGKILNPTALAHRIVNLVEEKQAEDIIMLDLRQVSVITDYFVICSAMTERQTKALLDTLTEEIGKEGLHPLHVEGETGSGWLLIDYGDVIVHIFAPAQRAYYKLEELWQRAPMVVRIQ
jgi:ribosome-associated protein